MSEFDPRLRSEPTQPQPQDAPRPSRRSALLLWMLAGLGLVAVGLLSIPLVRAFPNADVEALSFAVDLAYYLPFLALPVFLLARQREGLWQAYRPYPISLMRVISIVALALLGVFFFTDLSALWSILLEALGLNLNSPGILIPTNARELTLSIFSVAVLPAVCEEFLFRGAILSAHERYGSRYAVLAAAVLFALLHGSLEGLPVEFLVGVLLGWLVIYCDSIYASLIYHTTHNAATVILQFLAYRSSSPEELNREMTMLEAVGGTAGLVQLALELLVLGAMMLFSLRMLRLTARLRGVEFAPPKPRERLRGSEWALLILGIFFVALMYAAKVFVGLMGGAA